MEHTQAHPVNTDTVVKRTTVGSLMRLNPRFRRSVQIELDLNDRASTENYVITDFVKNCFRRLSASFEQGSSQRAWRLTGDYGSGKSAFALAVAKAAAGRAEELPVELQGIISGNPLLPIIVTGDREPLVKGIGRALIGQIESLHENVLPATTEELLTLLEHSRLVVEQNGKAGVLLVLDELGKNLEYSTLEPQSSDVYCLQRLAETASRSGGRPFILLGILHQGLASYTASLDAATRREWDKVAGRFDEIIFSHPIEQTVLLCAEALNIDVNGLPSKIVKESRESMQWAVRSGMYGTTSAETLVDLAPRLFPLHPTVLPPLLNLLRRFAQNERSLFGFFSGYEPRSLQDFSGVSLAEAKFFRLTDLYDYFRENLAHTMTNGRATHWRIIESVVRQVPNIEVEDISILKSIGILNAIDDDSLLATQDMLLRAVDQRQSKKLNTVLQQLEAKHVLYERGAVRGYCLWPHTSVHLADCFENARLQLEDPTNSMRMVSSLLDPQTIVARRHYVETGNLRHFEVQFHSASEYEQLCKDGIKPAGVEPDGYVLVLLPENEREFKVVAEKLNNPSSHSGSKVVVGLTRPPIELLSAANDLKCWNWVQDNIMELAGDQFARQELKSQIINAKNLLDNRQEKLTGLNSAGHSSSTSWFWQGEPFHINANGIGASLSILCDNIYPSCPIVTNELINRRITSSAASRARTLLIEAISAHPDKPFLGMDTSKNPPELAIYLSVLLTGNVHVCDQDKWTITIPSEQNDKGRLRPALLAIDKLLKENDGQRIGIPRIFAELRKEPIGARDGMLPLLLAIYLAACWHQTAAYESGTYRHRLGGEEFKRLIKEPEYFELQHCAIEGVRLDLFYSLSTVLSLNHSEKPEILDLVRPLVSFIAEVPEYSRNTKKLSSEALALRKCLLEARDPAKLIFTDIPVAAGVQANDHDALAVKLPRLISEIQTSYDILLNRVAASIIDSFETSVSINELRSELITRCAAISSKLAEVELKSFVLRLGDAQLNHRQWLESLANHLSRKSAARWYDSDEDTFHQRLGVLAKRMIRAEAANSDFTGKFADQDSDRVVRLALTKPNGIESTRMLHWSETEEEQVRLLETQITSLIQEHGRAGLSAAVRAIWNQFEKN
ncbi:MAG: hypothetical protein K9L79_06620 [Methylobacter tundripaludum]|nr:hypothetical protein [Methylobacter tundripaludum]